MPITLPKSSTSSRSTTEFSACSTCSIQMIDDAARVDGADGGDQLTGIRLRSGRRRSRRAAAAFGSVASARASSSRLRSQQAQAPGRIVGAVDQARSPPGSRRSAPPPRLRVRARAEGAGDQEIFEHGQLLERLRDLEGAAHARQAARHRRRVGHVARRRKRCGRHRPAILPVIRLNSVDLPAPFGPMMPSASPSPKSNEITLARPSARRRICRHFRATRIGIVAYRIVQRWRGVQGAPPRHLLGDRLPSCRRPEYSAPSCCR